VPEQLPLSNARLELLFGPGSSAGRCRSAAALPRDGLIVERPRALLSLRQFGFHG